MFQSTQYCTFQHYTTHNHLNTVSFTNLPYKSTTPIKYILNYVIDYDHSLGKGNFSSVYRCSRPADPGKYFAVKLLSVNTLRMKKIQHLAKAQIQILRKINHKNVISCRDVYWDENWYYIFTDYYEGNLEEFIKKGRIINQAEMLPIIKDIFDGLLYLQRSKIVHRDIKPANIFLKDGRAVVADLGFARFFNEPFYDLQIGSLPYMSPQGITKNYYHTKTDVWAFGAMVYQILHGQNPYLKCMDINQLLKKVHTPVSVVSLRLDLSIQIKQMIVTCLEIDYEKRPKFSEIQSSWYFKNIFKNKSSRLKQLIKSDFQSPLKSYASEQNLLIIQNIDKTKQESTLSRCLSFNRLAKLKSDIKQKKDQNQVLLIMSPTNSSKMKEKQTDLYPYTQNEIPQNDYYGYMKKSSGWARSNSNEQSKQKKKRQSMSEQKINPLKQINKNSKKTKIQDLKIKNSNFLHNHIKKKYQFQFQALNNPQKYQNSKSPVGMNKTAGKLLGRYFHSPNTTSSPHLNLSPSNCTKNYKFNAVNENHLRVKNTPFL